MGSAELCFSLSLAPCENQIVLCLKRKGEKGFAYTPFKKNLLVFLKRRRKKRFSVTWVWMLLLKGQTTGRNVKENLSWTNNVEFFFSLVALNPIRSLIRVMHRDFTLQVGFFEGAFGAEVPEGPDWRLASLMCFQRCCGLVSHWSRFGSADDIFHNCGG